MNIKEVLKEQLKIIKPSDKEIDKINKETKDFLKFLGERIKKLKIRADVFLGGSFAKGTIIKKEKYDVDVFIRFDKIEKFDKIFSVSYKRYKKIKIHGSRDYWQLRDKNLIFEIVPVKKIKKPEEAENVTDLSFFHVSYVKKHLEKDKKLGDEIILAKAFCHAQGCYGAESYISGFSGYALELLIIYYKSFEKFLNEANRIKERKIIDIEKKYKSEKEALMEINESKLMSPIILIDPTFQRRNALAALSKETFEKFKNAARDFLANPRKELFEKKKLDLSRYNLCLKTGTDRQEGGIAGSKLLKFHEFLKSQLDRYFEIKKEEFKYDDKKEALSFFMLKSRGKIILHGPKITDVENLVKFKEKHKDCFIKDERAYARENFNISPENFLLDFKKKYKSVMKDMGIIRMS